MWKVTPPTETVDTVLQRCTSNIRDLSKRARLRETSNALMAASEDFMSALEAGTVHEFPQTEAVGRASKAELIWLYDSKMADPRAPARAIYDRLRMAAPYGRCPLCGRGLVATLDHHLPKTQHADLTIAPMNLIPACQDCNKTKSQTVPSTASEVPIHPYTDDVDTAIWLRARVVEVAPPAIFFVADPPLTWNATLRDRLRNHFRLYKLRSAYAAEGATLLSNTRDFFIELAKNGGPQAIREHAMAMAASSRRINQNSWQAAAYTAMAESDWFCNGGHAAAG